MCVIPKIFIVGRCTFRRCHPYIRNWYTVMRSTCWFLAEWWSFGAAGMLFTQSTWWYRLSFFFEFFFNEKIQAYCFLIAVICGHQLAVWLMVESVRNEDAFYGVRTTNSYELVFGTGWMDFKANNTIPGSSVRMGNSSPDWIRGTYYLQTNTGSPRGRSMAGITYQ